MNKATLINQTSGETEYYTPIEIVEAARRVMGSIDLDPASSPVANRHVQAKRFFTEEDDGLTHDWSGNVWMNHPFGKEDNPLWVGKLVKDFYSGWVTQACCITYACTSERWFQPLYDFPLCFLAPRTNYRLPDGSTLKGVTKGSVVAYLGPAGSPNLSAFVHEFSRLGSVMLPATPRIQLSPSTMSPLKSTHGKFEPVDLSDLVEDLVVNAVTGVVRRLYEMYGRDPDQKVVSHDNMRMLVDFDIDGALEDWETIATDDAYSTDTISDLVREIVEHLQKDGMHELPYVDVSRETRRIPKALIG